MRWHDHQLPSAGSSEHPWAAIYFNQEAPPEEKEGINITNSRTFRSAIHQSWLWHRFDTVRPGREMALSLRNPGLEQKSRTLKELWKEKGSRRRKKERRSPLSF
ncbi:hypothetical protein AVEN_205459-1 [Araneus ventricosus]|uniref:Uncharacterized protein n=1 Tax=Araneus ventricosus TaxID=182803 RepID=A0A4Y2CCS2_ARAVE|nr:hypothetical protein AVEN_205459-1 [Araneus ventricosus]